MIKSMWRWVIVLAGLPLGCAQEPGQTDKEPIESSCSDQGRTTCENSCVDLLTDSTNCGACGVVCSAGQSCQSGACGGGPDVGGTGGGDLATGGASTGGTLFTELLLEEGDAGQCDVDGIVESTNTGFTGPGYLNTDNTVGASIEWAFSVAEAGTYSLEFTYASPSGDRPGNVLVDGVDVANAVSFGSTSSWTTWSTVSVDVTLAAGDRRIALSAADAAGLANIDSLKVTGAALSEFNCNGNVGTGGSGTGGNGTGGNGTGGTTGGTGGSDPAPGCGNAAAPKGAQNLTLQLNGKERKYLLFVPDGYDPTKSIPLIFAWHSAGAPPAESRRYYKLEPVTGDGAIIVYPEGINGGWDLAAEGVDVKFFDAMLASLNADYCIDQERVFSTGYSFGGMMSFTLACSRGSQLRAFAPMAGAFFGGLPSGGRCATPVPGWIAHATNDNLVSYSSGQAARDVWIKTNGCETTTTPFDPSPCVAYQCSEAPLHWCSHTQGHEWPNFASKAVWAFFQSQ